MNIRFWKTLLINDLHPYTKQASFWVMEFILFPPPKTKQRTASKRLIYLLFQDLRFSLAASLCLQVTTQTTPAEMARDRQFITADK